MENDISYVNNYIFFINVTTLFRGGHNKMISNIILLQKRVGIWSG